MNVYLMFTIVIIIIIIIIITQTELFNVLEYVYMILWCVKS